MCNWKFEHDRTNRWIESGMKIETHMQYTQYQQQQPEEDEIRNETKQNNQNIMISGNVKETDADTHEDENMQCI